MGLLISFRFDQCKGLNPAVTSNKNNGFCFRTAEVILKERIVNVVSRVTKATQPQEYRVEPQAATVTRVAVTVQDVIQATGVTVR